MLDLEVTLSAYGVPASFVYEDFSWVIGVEPQRWFERIPRWETKSRTSTFAEGNRIDVEVWQGNLRVDAGWECLVCPLRTHKVARSRRG